ncbi:ANTAR domain-containing protein [Cellulomonas sp. Marseille-Q8402]
MTDRAHLLRALAQAVARHEPTSPGGADVPVAERLCRAAVDLLGARGAALTCAPTGAGRYTACATDDVASRLDEIEGVVGDGPGVRAFREGRPVGTLLGVVPRPVGGEDVPGPDDRTGARPEELPVFAVLAGEVTSGSGVEGPVSVRSWPVRSATRPVAVLTVYGLPASAGADVVEDGQVLADALAPVLAGATAADADDQSRVHRAVGMVVAQTGLAPADAHAMLRARAWAEDVRVTALAGAVLERRASFDRGGAPETQPPL